MERNPSRSSCSAWAERSERCLSRGEGSTRIRAAKNAANTNTAPAATSTAPTLVAATRMPPKTDPTMVPMLSIVLDAAFAAVSSSGLRASEGRSDVCVGQNIVWITALTAVNA